MTTHMPNCVSSSDLKVTGINVILLIQDSFESNCPEKNFQKLSS